MGATSRFLAVVAFSCAAASCTFTPKVTYLDVSVLFDSQVSIDQLVFWVSDGSTTLFTPTPRPDHAATTLMSGGRIAIILSDAEAGHTVTTHVTGRYLGIDVTTGQSDATAVVGRATPVAVVLGKSASLSSLAITPDDALSVGAVQPFTATGTFSDGTTLNLTSSATWVSSDSTVLAFADPTQPGLANALAVGSATVTVTVAQLGVTATVPRTVSAATLTSLSLTPVALQLPTGLSQKLRASGAFSDGTARDLTDQVAWSSGDPNIAAFDATNHGLLNARQPGIVTITASQTGVSATDPVTVTSATLTQIMVSPTNPQLPLGALKQFFATGIFSDGTSLDLTTQVSWSSSDPTSANVSDTPGAKGVVAALMPATVTVTATLGDTSGATALTVTPATLRSLAITGGATLAKGTSAHLTATGTYSDSTTQDLTAVSMWTSGAASVISVGNDAATKGLVSALDVGSAKISAQVGSTTATTTIVGSSAMLTTLSVTPATPTLPKGGTQQLSATGVFTDHTVQDLTAQATWSSSDSTIANVSNIGGTSGLVIAAGTGTAIVTAALNGSAGSTTVTATQARLTSLTITPSNLAIANGTLAQFSASGVFSDQSTQDLTTRVTWTSSSPGVATLSNAPGLQGLATSVTPGSTTVTAALSGVTTTTALTITPAQLSTIGVTPTNPSVADGIAQQFHAIGIYTDNTTQDLTAVVTWASSDPNVATVSNAAMHGLASTLKANASCNITATLGAISGGTMLNVTSAVLQTIQVTPTNPSAPAGTTLQLIATGVYSDGSQQDLTSTATWATGDATVATVSNAGGSHGLLSAVKLGSTSVSAMSLSMSGGTTVTVSAATLVSLDIQPSDPSIALGTQQQFSAVGTYSDHSTRDLTAATTWISSAPAVASISNSNGSHGLASGLKMGQTSIVSAVSGGVSTSTTLTVTAAQLLSLMVTPTNTGLALGTTLQLTAVGTYTDASTQDLTTTVTWVSSTPLVAAVSNASGSNGLVTTVASASAPVTLTASSGSISGATQVTVTAAKLVSISVTPTSPTIALGTTVPLTATGIYTDRSMQNLTTQVTWTVPDLTVAAVSNSNPGLVTSLHQGTVSVTAAISGISGATSVTVTPATLTSVALTPPAPSIALGTPQQFTAVGTYTDLSTQDLTTQLTWSSSNTAIATVSNASGSQGYAQSVSSGGPITITATQPGGVMAATAQLTVTTAQLVSLTVTPPSLTRPLGTSVQLAVSGAYTDHRVQDLTAQATWSSSNPLVATVSNAQDSPGFVTTVGSASMPITITASFGGQTASTSLTVTAAGLRSIAVTPTNPSLALGTTQNLYATGTYTDNSTQDLTLQVTWSSSNPQVATVSNADGSAGLVTSVTAAPQGPVTMTASFGGQSGSTNVVVTAATLVSIAVTPSDPSFALGTTQQLTATGTYTDNSTQDLTTQVSWSAGDPTVATVSNANDAGLASSVRKGTTTVNADFSGVRGSTLVTVSDATLQVLTVTPTNPSIALGLGEQFTATGTYSDGSTQDLTAQVTWGSSNTSVASISDSDPTRGLAQSLAQGQTTIVSASVGSVTGSTTLTVTGAGLKSLSVTPESAVIALGTQQQFAVTGNYTDGTVQVLTANATWSTSDPTVATISNASDSPGLATSVASSNVAIGVYADFGGMRGQAQLTVAPKMLQTIAITPSQPSLSAGTQLQLIAIGTYSDQTTADLSTQVTWSTSDPTVATIDNTLAPGLVSGLAQGSITVDAAFGSILAPTVPLNVTSATLSTITITPAAGAIANGTELQLTAVGTFTDMSMEDLTLQVGWLSGDPTVVAVSNAVGSEGLAQSVAPGGPVTITAALAGVVGTASLRINDVSLLSIAITPADQTIVAGAQLQLSAMGTFSDQSQQVLTNQVAWATGDDTAVSVSSLAGSAGLCIGIAGGGPPTTVSGSTLGVTGTTTVTVTVE